MSSETEVRDQLVECLKNTQHLHTLPPPIQKMLMEQAPKRLQEQSPQDILINRSVEQAISTQTIRRMVRKALRAIDLSAYEQIYIPFTDKETQPCHEDRG